MVGAALIEVIRNSLTLLGISTFWQGAFVGSFIVLAVAFDRIRASRELGGMRAIGMAARPAEPRRAVADAAAVGTAPEARPEEPRSRVLRISGASVHAALAEEIGQRIVRGDYPPGTLLPNEAKWSQIFDVSRSAVREAIKMLMAKGLLTSRPKVGSRVEPRERWNLLDRDVLAWYARRRTG